MIKIKWFGHSLWSIKSESIIIATDPYSDIGYNLNIPLSADIVLSSHDHFDHNNVGLAGNDPVVIKDAGEYYCYGVKFEMIPVWHDKEKGAKRGANLLMKFTMDGKSFLHCGDLGHIPETETIEKIGEINVLMVPVGGVFTIDAAEAREFVEIIKPNVILPMHYKTAALNFRLDPVDKFLSFYSNVKKIEQSEIVLEDEYFNTEQPVVIMMNYE